MPWVEEADTDMNKVRNIVLIAFTRDKCHELGAGEFRLSSANIVDVLR